MNHSYLFTAEFKNEWSYTSALHIRLHGVHREDTFTFNFTVNGVMRYGRYGDSQLSCLESIVRRFGDVIILVRLIEVYSRYIDVVLMGCISYRLRNTHTGDKRRHNEKLCNIKQGNVHFVNLYLNFFILMSFTCFETEGSSSGRRLYRGADKSLARPERKQATAAEDFDVHISYL